MIVSVYWNLNKKCWSIKHNNLVIGYADTLLLSNVNFKVSEAGRQRVIKQKRKNVHAYAIGEIIETNGSKPEAFTKELTYNPYYFANFVVKDNPQEVVYASDLLFCGNKKIYMRETYT